MNIFDTAAILADHIEQGMAYEGAVLMTARVLAIDEATRAAGQLIDYVEMEAACEAITEDDLQAVRDAAPRESYTLDPEAEAVWARPHMHTLPDRTSVTLDLRTRTTDPDPAAIRAMAIQQGDKYLIRKLDALEGKRRDRS